VHRVWVDAFELAAHQVTNAEYEDFLATTGVAQPPQWNDANYNDPRMPGGFGVLRMRRRRIANGSARDGQTVSLPTKRNGSGRLAAAVRVCCIRGETRRREFVP